MYVIHHVQLAMPPGEEDQARAFFGDILGMEELDKPPELARRGGAWFRAGHLELHLGVEPDFAPARKAHPGILTDDLDAVRTRLEAADWESEPDGALSGFRRFYTTDCFDNRLEFLEPNELTRPPAAHNPSQNWRSRATSNACETGRSSSSA